jgi:hypothetical protein
MQSSGPINQLHCLVFASIAWLVHADGNEYAKGRLVKMSAFAYKTLLGCLNGPLAAFESYRGFLLLSLALRCAGRLLRRNFSPARLPYVWRPSPMLYYSCSYCYSSFVLGWRLQLVSLAVVPLTCPRGSLQLGCQPCPILTTPR